MPHIALDAARPLPRWVRIAGSLAVGFHFLVIGALAIGAPSGPWHTPVGPSMAIGPHFVKPVTDIAVENYLQPLRMTHNYHFASNRTAMPGVYFEVTLRDDKGQFINKLKFPEEKVNPWVRHRQTLLAQGLAEDQPIEPQGTEIVSAPNKKIQTVTIWEPGPSSMTLKKVPLHLIPRDRPVASPAEWSLVLAQSYMRHLCKQHRAASAELVRHSREPVMPAYLFAPELPPGAFNDLVCNFGEYRREQ